jgi:hypothetical protein
VQQKKKKKRTKHCKLAKLWLISGREKIDEHASRHDCMGSDDVGNRRGRRSCCFNQMLASAFSWKKAGHHYVKHSSYKADSLSGFRRA